MQIIIFGMHRSGTSPLARIINLMGAYLGLEGDLMEPQTDNPKGFWERRDVYALHQDILRSGGADWHTVNEFDLGQLSPEQRTAAAQRVRKIVSDLDTSRPWVVKDPRICLLFPVWREFLEVPVCVHIYRHPIEVARSLQTRNGFPLQLGIALWEQYHLAALTNTHGLPRLLVSHRCLMEQPVATIHMLYDDLVSLGIQGLHCPSEREIRAFIDPNLYRAREEPTLTREMLNQAQLELYDAFEEQRILEHEVVPVLSAGGREVLTEYCVIEKRVALLEGEVRQRQQAVEALEAEVQSRGQALQRRDAEVETLQRQAASQTEELRERLEQVALLEGEVRQRQQAVEALEAEVQSRGQALQRRDAEVETLQRQAASQTEELRERLEQVALLEGEVRQRQQAVEALGQALQRRERSSGKQRAKRKS